MGNETFISGSQLEFSLILFLLQNLILMKIMSSKTKKEKKKRQNFFHINV